MKYLFFLLFLLGSQATFAQKKKVKKQKAVIGKTADSTGLLTGKANVGPLCPTEPCNVSPERLAEAFKTLQLVVTSDEKKFIKKYDFTPKGTFSMTLPAGVYRLLIQPKQGYSLDNKVTEVTIEAGKTTKIVLDYNTGLQ
jgi:hypothetical protein